MSLTPGQVSTVNKAEISQGQDKTGHATQRLGAEHIAKSNVTLRAGAAHPWSSPVLKRPPQDISHLDAEQVPQANLRDIVADVLVVPQRGTRNARVSGRDRHIGLQMPRLANKKARFLARSRTYHLDAAQ